MAKRTIVVMSDSHGDAAIVKTIKEKWENQADLIFHNGDSELAAKDPIWQGIQVVGGNMDFDPEYLERRVVEFDKHRIVQTHGHLHLINYTMDKLAYWAQEMGATICLYGHLHVPAAYQEEGILYLNPGSISQPRGPIQECLYAVLNLDENSIQVDYYNREHTLYPSLSKVFSI